MIDNTFSALFSSSIIRPLLFSCAIWSAMLIGCLLYFIFLKTKVPPWFAIQVGSVVETVGAKIRSFSILTKYFYIFFSFALIVNALSIIANGKNLVFLTLNFHFFHLSFPLFALLPPSSFRDNPTPNAPVTHPQRPSEADKARFRFSPPLYFCAVFQA